MAGGAAPKPYICAAWTAGDNGPEFILNALDVWANEREIKLQLVWLGKLVDHAGMASFNGRFVVNACMKTGS